MRGIPLAVAIGLVSLANDNAAHAEVNARAETTTVVWGSKAGARETCAVNTKAGVTLVKSLGPAACELGRTWGYDANGIWVQLYAGAFRVFGEYGDPHDFRVGATFFPWSNQVVRWNFEFIQLNRSPVGAGSLPYSVGTSGPVFHSNLMVWF